MTHQTPLEFNAVTRDDLNEMITMAKKQDVEPRVADDGTKYLILNCLDQDGDEVLIHVPVDGGNLDAITKTPLWRE
jgi:hypothetical protein